MYKKLMALTSIIILLCIGNTYAEEQDIFEIKPTFLPVFEITADNYYGTKEDQTILASVAFMDVLFTQNDNLTSIATNAVNTDRIYIGVDEVDGESVLHTYFWDSDKCLLLLYAPQSNALYAQIISLGYTANDLVVALMMQEMQNTSGCISCTKVSGENVNDYYNLILGMLIEE